MLFVLAVCLVEFFDAVEERVGGPSHVGEFGWIFSGFEHGVDLVQKILIVDYVI